MTKSIKEWFKLLPEPYRTQAEEYRKRASEDVDQFAGSLANAVWYGFFWRETSEGNDYWHSVHTWAYKNPDGVANLDSYN